MELYLLLSPVGISYPKRRLLSSMIVPNSLDELGHNLALFNGRQGVPACNWVEPPFEVPSPHFRGQAEKLFDNGLFDPPHRDHLSGAGFGALLSSFLTLVVTVAACALGRVPVHHAVAAYGAEH
jgi:hypothetical protein